MILIDADEFPRKLIDLNFTFVLIEKGIRFLGSCQAIPVGALPINCVFRGKTVNHAQIQDIENPREILLPKLMTEELAARVSTEIYL